MKAEEHAFLRLGSLFWRGVHATAVVETLRLMRDRTSFSLVVLVPVIQIVLFGSAVNLDPKHVSLAVAGGSPSGNDRVEQLARNSGYFGEIVTDLPPGLALQRLKNGLVKVAIELPDNAAFFDDSDLAEEATSELQVYADGSDAGAVAPALAALERAVLTRLLERASDLGLEGPPLLARADQIGAVWLFNPERKTTWSLLPGLLGVILMISMLMLGALTLAREREQGTFESLLVMPISASAVLLGKLLPYLVVSFLQVCLVLATATFGFGLPLSGSAVLLCLGAILLAYSHLVLGFAISAMAANQMQALQSAVGFYLPSMLLSGFMFPFNGMPAWAQVIGNMLPLTHFVRFARDIMLKGFGVADVAVHLQPILMFAGVASLLALIVFRCRLD